MQGDPKTKKNVTLTCPNTSCKKVITNPLKTLNRQQSSKEPYYACPYCLTKINFTETENDPSPEKQAAETSIPEEQPSYKLEKTSICNHYFGYMSEKEHKQQMPDECMLCSQIIDCMAEEKGSAKGKS